jgi:hypothetical protein
MVGLMTSESRRHDLYSGLTGILGTELADALMAYLPTSPGVGLVTRADIDGLKLEIRELRAEVHHLSDRFDRFQLTLVAGFMSMIVALIVVGFFG